MLNDQYEPRTDGEDEVLAVLRREGGRLRPKHIYSEVGTNTGTAQHWIDRLYAAGWIARPRDGVYELAYDPRQMTDEELAEAYLEHALELAPDTVLSHAEDIVDPSGDINPPDELPDE